jgi:hypothetical protein
MIRDISSLLLLLSLSFPLLAETTVHIKEAHCTVESVGTSAPAELKKLVDAEYTAYIGYDKGSYYVMSLIPPADEKEPIARIFSFSRSDTTLLDIVQFHYAKYLKEKEGRAQQVPSFIELRAWLEKNKLTNGFPADLP